MTHDPKHDQSGNAQFDAELDAALRCAPEVHAPRNFRQRLMTRLPEVSEVERPLRWQLPVVVALVLLFCGVLMAFRRSRWV